MARHYHVLVVEDEPLVADMVQEILESEYRVSSAGSADDALALLRTSHVDAVLLDSMLPQGRSAEIARLAQHLGAAVIEMSAYPGVIAGFAGSRRPHLIKPFGAKVLLATMASALSGRTGVGEIEAGPPAHAQALI